MKTQRGEMSRRPSSGKRSDRRPVKRGIHLKGSWKSVDLDPSLFSDEAMGGLVCFEELTDYRLVDTAQSAVRAQKEAQKEEKKKAKSLEKKKLQKEKRKAKKRKATKEEEDGAAGEQKQASDGGEVNLETSEKPAKKKRKKGKKKNVSPEEAPGPNSSTEGGGKQVVEKPESNQTHKDVSETVTEKKGGEKEAGGECVSQDGALEKEAPSQSVNTETNDKKKRKKKNRRQRKKSQADKQTDTKEEEESRTTEKIVISPKLSKKKAKNWSTAALSGSEDQNSDVSAWKDLFVPDPVLKALSSLGFASPTAIQALVLPPAIRDQLDIVGAAETGSGKTLSFGIPMIHAILEWRKGEEEDGQGAGQPGATSQVESLYLPPAEGADKSSVTQGEGEETETGVALAAETGDKAPHPAEPAEDEDEDREDEDEDKEEEEGGDVTECDSHNHKEEEGDFSHDEADLRDEVEEEEESEDERMGCVKVIEDVEFDFDNPAGEEEAQAANHKQPLLGLVLTPTRELAVQVKHHIDAVAKFTGIRTAIVVGGMAQQKQTRMLKRRPEIIIATPGRLWEMISEKHPHLINLRQLRCLVIDEADRMVERGHFAELENLLEMLNTVQFNPKRQTFVFSATLTMAHSLPTRVLQKKGKRVDDRSKLELMMEKVGIRSKPKVIDLTRKQATVESLTETRIHCEEEEKDFFLYYFLLQYPGRTMVFANSIDCIKRLNALLVIMDAAPLPLHANMHQKQRLKNLERFAERESSVLLTTDVAARGLDIPNVQHVIHYQVPRTSETYVHRSGRTARATKEGLSLLLIGPADMMNFRKIYKTLGKDEDLPMFPVQTRCMAAIKERVNMARKIEKIEYHNSKEKQHNSWFRQAAEALEVDLDEDLLMGGRKDEEDERQQQRMVKGMKKHLKHLLSQPVFKNMMKTKYPTQMGKLSLPQMPLAGVETALTSVNIQRSRQKPRRKQQQQQQQQ